MNGQSVNQSMQPVRFVFGIDRGGCQLGSDQLSDHQLKPGAQLVMHLAAQGADSGIGDCFSRKSQPDFRFQAPFLVKGQQLGDNLLHIMAGLPGKRQILYTVMNTL